MNFSDGLLELAIGQIWQVTILCVVVGWISNTLLTNRPALKYYLGLLVMVKCVTPPVWASHCGVFSWVFQNLSEATTAFVTKFLGPSVDPQYFAMAVVGIWTAGFVFTLARTVATWHRIQKRIEATTNETSPVVLERVHQLIEKLGIRKSIRVALTSEPIGPAIIGVWKPTMILPTEVVENKTAEELEPILAHELLHVRRGDTWVAMLETVVRACWWFHPQVHRTADETSQAGELCCDQDVLRELFYPPRRYADSLLDVCEAKCRLQPLLGRPGIRTEQVTRDRLTRIMKSKQSRPRRLLNIGLLILGLMVVLPGSSLQSPAAKDTESAPQPSPTAEHSSDLVAALTRVGVLN